jgi:putative transposase
MEPKAMRKRVREDIGVEQITELYRKEKHGRIKERLLAIKLIYEGKKISEIAAELGICQKTIYNWIDRWNADGYEGLQLKSERAGRKGHLTPQEWQEIMQEIGNKQYTVQEILDYIRDTRGEHYSYQGVWRVLNKYLGTKRKS